MLTLDTFPAGFHEDHGLRSDFIRAFTLRQLNDDIAGPEKSRGEAGSIPRTLVRYWHDPEDLPSDVRACLDSWERLRGEGFEFRLFDDRSAELYISEHYGAREREAFGRCRHPAMRADFLRLCFIFAEGGFYVDADDVLAPGDGWRTLFADNRLKVQPLAYDIATSSMVAPDAIWNRELPTASRIFYVNNDPLAAPGRHPVLRLALERATGRLLETTGLPEIQETTGPGNLTAVLARHVHARLADGAPLDVALLRDWNAIAETRWDLGYRNDARNWRTMTAD